MASTREQIAWAKLSQDVPPRAFFSGHVGAIILRADHCCWYLNHFIGLRNMRFFLQSVFWGFLFTCGFVASCTMALPLVGFSVNGICCFLCAALGVLLLVMHFVQIRLSVIKIKNNQTLLELNTVEKGRRADREKKWDLGLVRNLEEIFGTVWLFPLWFLPIPLPLPADGMSYNRQTVPLGLDRFVPFS
jgi:hypothetical protein